MGKITYGQLFWCQNFLSLYSGIQDALNTYSHKSSKSHGGIWAMALGHSNERLVSANISSLVCNDANNDNVLRLF